MHHSPHYWTRQRIHITAEFCGSLILIHNFAWNCLESSGTPRISSMKYLYDHTVRIQMRITHLFLIFSTRRYTHVKVESASKAFPVWAMIERGNQPPLRSIEAHPSVSLLYLLLCEISAMQPGTSIIDKRVKNTQGTCTNSRTLV